MALLRSAQAVSLSLIVRPSLFLRHSGEMSEMEHILPSRSSRNYYIVVLKAVRHTRPLAVGQDLCQARASYAAELDQAAAQKGRLSRHRLAHNLLHLEHAVGVGIEDDHSGINAKAQQLQIAAQHALRVPGAHGAGLG